MSKILSLVFRSRESMYCKKRMVEAGLSYQVFNVRKAGKVDQSKKDLENPIVGLRVLYLSQ